MKKGLIGDEVWNELIGEVNKDGQISKQEFKKMMTKLVDGTISKEITPRQTQKGSFKRDSKISTALQ